jgi:hypothetical protein
VEIHNTKFHLQRPKTKFVSSFKQVNSKRNLFIDDAAEFDVGVLQGAVVLGMTRKQVVQHS